MVHVEKDVQLPDFNTGRQRLAPDDVSRGYLGLQEFDRRPVLALLATSKSGTLLLRRDQGDVAALLDSRRCRL